MAEPADSELFHFNGINGETGGYELPPMAAAELVRFITGEAKPENLSELRHRHDARSGDHYAIKEGADPKDLAQAGWGIIFPHGADPAIKEALTPLLKLRESQAGERFRIYDEGAGYRPNDSKSAWLGRPPRRGAPGPADPDKVPYYLLICGDPATIPYRFQTQLDVQYAVGRIHFETLDEYANYARSVVEAETGGIALARRMRFFGVKNPADQATTLSAKHLVTPLHEQLQNQFDGWTFGADMAERATKARLGELLGGGETPALLFTASHGMEFPLDSKRQLPHQGALLCQDWPGPLDHKGPIPEDWYFAGTDLGSDANLLGLIAFFFACYGAGTPELDDFAKQAFKDQRARIAPKPFLAGLPTRMLGLAKGGALAVIGHVERAWTYSFRWQRAGTQTEVFRSTLHRLLEGHPVGSALEFFDERYAELSSVLSDELEEIDFGKQADPYEIAGMWTANNDARGYALIGDPAVRLPVAAAGEQGRPRGPLPPLDLGESTATAPSAGAETPAHDAPPDPATEGPAEEHGSYTATSNTGEGRRISTWLAADPASGADRTLAVETRIAPDGSVETTVAKSAADNGDLLRLHAALVHDTMNPNISA